MRFCDFFISYKLGLKDLKETIPFSKRPQYGKIATIILYILMVLILMSFMTLNPTIICFSEAIGIIIAIITIIVFCMIATTKKNLKETLQNNYQPYSQKRMNMLLNLLITYNIDATNINVIDLLIAEAKQAQIQSNALKSLKEPLKVLYATILPVILYHAQHVLNHSSYKEILILSIYYISILLMIFSIILCIVPLIKTLPYWDYNKYNDLIYDLRQVKIFYSQGNKSLLHHNEN